MSNRALVLTAVLLAVLLAAAGGLLAHRLGYFSTWEKPSFAFENSLLGVEKGERIVVRPLQPGAAWARLFFSVPKTEPDPETDLFPAPYVPFGLEERTGGTGDWRYVPPVRFLALGQMGAMTVKEWLEEIRLVREQGDDGSERLVVRARFGHENGGIIDYFHDPEQLLPGVGWYRHEMRATEGPPTVFFATDAGKVEVD
jgi:hypothetical protein